MKIHNHDPSRGHLRFRAAAFAPAAQTAAGRQQRRDTEQPPPPPDSGRAAGHDAAPPDAAATQTRSRARQANQPVESTVIFADGKRAGSRGVADSRRPRRPSARTIPTICV